MNKAGEPVWRTGTALFPALEGSATADLCVVGLGGSGLAAVAAGLNQGMTVVGVDAGRVASGAAGRNGGFLLAGPARFHHRAREEFGVDAAARLYERTAAEIVRMADVHPAVELVGSLRVAASPQEAEDISRHMAALQTDGFPAQEYSGPEGTGLLVPGDGVFDPGAWCGALADRVSRGGAALFEHSAAVHIDQGCVTTSSGEVRCTHIVVAVDGRLEALVPELAGRVTTWRLQMLSTAPSARRLTRHAVYHRYGLDYWQQLPDGRLVLGGGRDVGGEAEQTDVLGTTAGVQGFLEELARDKLGVEATVDRRWSGLVGYTSDGLPICEEVRPGVHALGGYCGTGNVIGALAGRDTVRRLSGKTAEFLEVLDGIRTTQGVRPVPLTE